MRYLLLLLFLTGCANMPTAYGDRVKIVSGLYAGSSGRLSGDCSGFENYRVELNNGKVICARSWQMEKAW